MMLVVMGVMSELVLEDGKGRHRARMGGASACSTLPARSLLHFDDRVLQLLLLLLRESLLLILLRKLLLRLELVRGRLELVSAHSLLLLLLFPLLELCGRNKSLITVIPPGT